MLVCTCTSTRLIPSVATWISGSARHLPDPLLLRHRGGLRRDAATASSEAMRLLQEVRASGAAGLRGEVLRQDRQRARPSRMIFGDGAAAMVIGVAPEGEPPDIEYLQTYASGPVSQVNSIIWPNPEFDNNITVYGPEVKALAGRYLVQMIDELTSAARSGRRRRIAAGQHRPDRAAPGEQDDGEPAGRRHAGLSPEQLYFNIEQVGNASSASIPLAIHDAVRDGVINGRCASSRPASAPAPWPATRDAHRSRRGGDRSLTRPSSG